MKILTRNSFRKHPMNNPAHVSGFLVLLSLSLFSAAAQLPSQDPRHKEDAEVAGVKFSVPNGFKPEPSPDSRVAFMRHEEYDLALFVALPEQQVGDEYLTGLSTTLVSLLSPKEKDFRWKVLQRDSGKKLSRYQTARGNTKGFNGERLFQTDYIAVKVGGREVLVGYITQLGQYGNNAKYLFDLKGVGGLSMPGWYAQAHVLASITGEKYEDINPGTYIRATPVKTN